MKESTVGKICMGIWLGGMVAGGLYLAPEAAETRQKVARMNAGERKNLEYKTGLTYEELLAQTDHQLTWTLFKADVRHKFTKDPAQENPDEVHLPYEGSKLRHVDQVFDANDLIIPQQTEKERN